MSNIGKQQVAFSDLRWPPCFTDKIATVQQATWETAGRVIISLCCFAVGVILAPADFAERMVICVLQRVLFKWSWRKKIYSSDPVSEIQCRFWHMKMLGLSCKQTNNFRHVRDLPAPSVMFMKVLVKTMCIKSQRSYPKLQQNLIFTQSRYQVTYK